MLEWLIISFPVLIIIECIRSVWTDRKSIKAQRKFVPEFHLMLILSKLKIKSATPIAHLYFDAHMKRIAYMRKQK